MNILSKSTLLPFTITLFLITNFSLALHAQIKVCDRYTIIELKDSGTSAGDAVYFKMTTDTNTTNTGYTDLFFVDNSGDTITTYNNWGFWLPSIKNIPNDTIEYFLYFLDSITEFPKDFEGRLVALNPECDIPFSYKKLGAGSVKIKNPSLLIYPNPAQDVIYIEHKAGLKPNRIELLNDQGQKVSVYHSSADGIKIDTLPDGIYNLLIYNDDGSYLVKRFIKQ